MFLTFSRAYSLSYGMGAIAPNAFDSQNGKVRRCKPESTAPLEYPSGSRRKVLSALRLRACIYHAQLLSRALGRPPSVEGNFDPKGLVLHFDNSEPMPASTFIATLRWLGVHTILQSTARRGL
jgi:hypothetical protein